MSLAPNYLSLSRHNVFYFRFPIPKDLHPEGLASHVRLSLRTSNQREALYIANMLAYHAEIVIRQLRHSAMKYDEIRKLVKDRLARLVKDGMTARLETGPYNKNDRKSYEHWLGSVDIHRIHMTEAAR